MTAHSQPNRHTGGKFLTVEALNEQERGDRGPFTTVYHYPTEAQRLYVSTHESACLTHITRYVTEHHRDGEYHHTTPHGWCGTFPGAGRRNRGYEWVDPSGEVFGCHKCVERAEHFGVDTMLLIPNTGCEATEGKRYR